jgi:ectoine hydroxylase-related dioxygenase (phytanoyl-CoA dioxygenase family)
MNNLDCYRENGFMILENVFEEKEINLFKKEIKNYVKNNKTIKNAGGITIPDFIKNKEFGLLSEVRNNSKINNMLKEIFGENYRFCGHNDIGINRIVGWHKDKLNNKYAKYETVNIWEEKDGEKHEIVKVLLYLQDHSNNNDGLKIVPKSHLVNNLNSSGFVQLKPKLGDVVIFDQRITHRGMEKQVPMERILVSFGFGKNNIFTDNFERGTVARQNEQNSLK